MSHFEIHHCSLAESKDAFRCLHRGVSADQQDALVATLEQLRGQGATFLDGLLVARERGEQVAAAWIQPAPGKTAILWPPDFASPAAPDLMREVENLLCEWHVPLAQMLIGLNAYVNRDVLALGGFCKLVELDYLELEHPQVDPKWSEPDLKFEPEAVKQLARLQALLLQSYEETLDCPQLNGLRDPADIVSSYQAQGNCSPEKWFLVQLDGQDIGVLILAEHDGGKVFELVYMGVLPTVRGRSLGEKILRHAIRIAAEGRAERLVLAVDTENAPAQAMYRRAGFVPWDRRAVYARIADNATT